MRKMKFFFVGILAVLGIAGTMLWKSGSSTPAPVETSVPVVEAPVPLTLTPVSVQEVNRIEELFAVDESQLPFIETVSYTSRVPWLSGRPAWIADYAAHYETSRHFIARSLNQAPNYFAQKISPGDRFNVFRTDKQIEFHVLVDLSLCKLWLYCIDIGENSRTLLKTYSVALGRESTSRASGYLTPLGKYSLGSKVAIYKPGMMGLFQNQQTEMIRVFGTRWIPFDKEIEHCTEPSKGNGLHGLPWVLDPKTSTLVEDLSKLGKHACDGGVCLAAADMEEIFAIVLTKPTTIELVADFRTAQLPGVEESQ